MTDWLTDGLRGDTVDHWPAWDYGRKQLAFKLWWGFDIFSYAINIFITILSLQEKEASGTFW